ncbi:MAG TPA: efflux RND transporter periplasmic adaptor subunit [Thermoanaerobaculia bacterium]|nr:efflux RND transporter periplasmic adaptor subunit [Thermoanaerobaculia bacterium]
MIRPLKSGIPILLLALIPLCGCSRPAAPQVVSERPPVAVEISRVSAGNIKESIAVVGTLASKFQGEVKAEFSGIVTDVYVTEWVRVSKGALLARFDSRDSVTTLRAATAARMQAEVGATRATRELDRMEKLKAAGLATEQSLDDARTASGAAEAQLNAAKAQEDAARTRLAKTEVLAPMDGVIAERTVNPGDYIQNMGSTKPMFRIVDNRRLELTVSIPSSRIAEVRLGQPLSFTTEAVPGRAFEGRVSFINPAADEASRTVKIVATVQNDADHDGGALKSGLFVKGAIVTGERTGVLRIPTRAMVTWDPGSRAGVVFVVSGERVQKKNVSTGAASGDEIEIASGMAAGETVVTRGAFDLRDGDRVRIVGPAGV